MKRILVTTWRIVQLICWVLVIFAVVTMASKASAGDYRVGVMPTSYHFTDRKQFASDDDNVDGWNETHNGVLIEKKITPEGDWLGGMCYENSIDDFSCTIYGANDAFFGKSEHLDMGLVYGAVTGYDWPLIPYVLPTLTTKFSETVKVRGIAFPIGVAAQIYVEF